MRLLFPLLFLAMSNIEWSERQPMPRGEAGGAAAFLGEDLVIAGGTAWDGDIKTWLQDVQVYRPGANRWSQGPKLPVPLAYGPFAASSSGLEIFGGTDGKTVHRTSWKLDGARTSWAPTGSVPADVLLGRAARIGDSTFIVGGCSDVADLSKCSDTVWQRRGDAEWRRLSRIPSGPLALHAIAVSGSNIYIFGGCSIPASGKVLNHNRAYRYDSSSGEWKSLRELPAGNRGLIAVAVSERSIYLFGGYTDAGFTSEVLLYDITKDSYTRLNPMPLGLLGIEFALNGNRIYGAGGEDRMRSRSARLFEGLIPVTKQ
jgi:N-acetylneuraminic acid mutarotase